MWDRATSPAPYYQHKLRWFKHCTYRDRLKSAFWIDCYVNIIVAEHRGLTSIVRGVGGCVHARSVEEVIEEAAGGAAAAIGHAGAEGAVEGGGRRAEEGVAHEGRGVRRVRVQRGVRVAVHPEETLEGVAGRAEGVVAAEERPEDLEGVHRVVGEVPPEGGTCRGTRPPAPTLAASTAAAAAAGPEALLAVVVVGGPLVGVGEDLVGLGDLLEALLRVARLVLVGVEFQGHLPVGLLDVVRPGVARDAEDGVVILAHGGRGDRSGVWLRRHRNYDIKGYFYASAASVRDSVCEVACASVLLERAAASSPSWPTRSVARSLAVSSCLSRYSRRECLTVSAGGASGTAVGRGRALQQQK